MRIFKTPKDWGHAFLGGGIAATAGVVLLATLSATAAPVTNPTQADAQDAITTLQNYVAAHPDVTPTPTPTPTVSPTASPTPTQAPAPVTVTAVTSSGQVVVNWTYTAPAGKTLSNFTVGRDGTDSTGSGPWSTTDPATARSRTFDKLVNGTAYHFTVTANYSDGTSSAPVSVTATPNPSTASPTPTSSVTPTTPAGGTRPSGLAWNSGVWANGSGSRADSFTTTVRGGRALDNFLVYTTRDSQGAQNNATSWRGGLPASFNGVNQDLVLAVTTWTSDGAFMTSAQAQAIGTSVCSLDASPIIRLDWEMNLPDGAGSNGAALTSANYTAWVARFRAAATGIKATCSGAKIDFNPNKGADQTSGCGGAVANWCSRRAFQELKTVVDIFGIDTYDSYPPVTSSNSGWNTRLTGTGELEESRAYAVANGKKFSVPEWGVACNGSGCQWQGNAGGDDPTYIHQMLGYFNSHAGDMAYDTYFDETASYIVSDLITNNPNSRAQYRSDILAA